MSNFPGLSFDEPEVKVEEKVEILYIFDTIEKLVNVYKVCRMYVNEYYFLDPTILSETLKEEKLPLLASLQDISVIHNSYLGIINPWKTDDK